MERRNIIAGVIVIGILVLALGGTYTYHRNSENATVTLIIDYGTLKEKDVYEDVKMPENSTVLDLLRKVTDVGTEETQYGKMVVSINGVSQDKDKSLWWTYTVNGKIAETGAETKLLNDGDVIQWSLIKF